MTTQPAVSIRPPAVAGLFYPAQPERLRRTLAALLADNPAPAVDVPVAALIAPHAGYVYSGPIAARAYNGLRPQADQLRRVVLLGPAHRVALRGLALPQATALRTPLGDVAVDRRARQRLRALPQVVESDLPHRDEHSLEVHLPFLQYLFGAVTVVPLVVGGATPEEVAEVLDALWDDPGTAVVISSDLSHYLPDPLARRVDAATAAQIEALDPRLTGEQACGAYPINGLLLTARRRGLSIRRLDLRNSADTAGDPSRVVGYGAWALNHA